MENYHPDWLLSPTGTRMELDIFIPDINTAIEIQGEQHFSFIGFFHKTYADFEKQKEYDKEKKNLCYGANVKLLEVCSEKDADIVAYELEEKYNKSRPKYFYQADDEYRKKRETRNAPNPEGNRKTRKALWNATDEAAGKRLKSLVEKVRKYEAGELLEKPEKVKKWKLVIQNNGYLVED